MGENEHDRGGTVALGVGTPSKPTPAVRIHVDVATTLLKDSGNRGIIIIAFGEAGYEITAAAASHEEAGPLAMVAKKLKDLLGAAWSSVRADAGARGTMERMIQKDIQQVQKDRGLGPQEATGMGVEGASE